MQEADFIPLNPALDSRAWPVARLLNCLRDQYLGMPESFYAPRLSDAARVQTLIDAIRRSHETNGAVHVQL